MQLGRSGLEPGRSMQVGRGGGKSRPEIPAFFGKIPARSRPEGKGCLEARLRLRASISPGSFRVRVRLSPALPVRVGGGPSARAANRGARSAPWVGTRAAGRAQPGRSERGGGGGGGGGGGSAAGRGDRGTRRRSRHGAQQSPQDPVHGPAAGAASRPGGGGAEIDEDRLPNPLLKPGMSMSPRQRKKVSRTTPTMKELQLMVEHHLCKQQADEEDVSTGSQEPHSPSCCPHANSEPGHSPGSCPLAQAHAQLGIQQGEPIGLEEREYVSVN
uniref:Protein phosphatase 1 regulatory subunit 1A n=1 Tax=Podarcis muralis TaxID=64176 RepID=A0A670IIR7_PODMU